MTSRAPPRPAAATPAEDFPSELSGAEFERLRTVIRERTGISMADSKRQLVYRRLSSRLRALRLNRFDDYIQVIEGGDLAEAEQFCNAVTTNLTAFFREQHHFSFLADKIVAGARDTAPVPKLRIWSAGCSTGEEPYSIALTLCDAVSDLGRWDVRILATDIDSAVLQTARNGVYPLERVASIPEDRLRKHFLRRETDAGTLVRVADPLRRLIAFKRLNLMDSWPMRGPFDAIFCRNVLIYFDKSTQAALVDRFAELVDVGGYLLLGHSETLLNITDRFELLGQTVYQRVR